MSGKNLQNGRRHEKIPFQIYEGLTSSKIGEMLGLTESGVHQIHRRAIMRLKVIRLLK